MSSTKLPLNGYGSKEIKICIVIAAWQEVLEGTHFKESHKCFCLKTKKVDHYIGPSLVAQPIKNLPCRRLGFSPWAGKISWRREWLPTPIFWPGEFHGQRSLVGYTVHGVAKTWT